MLLRVNGLFGWVRTNDRRSILLFAGFVIALNVAAALTLFIPLAAFDPTHAPVFAFGGYLFRYVPLVTIGAVGVFALQMLWHVKSVKRLVAFTFVDDTDEPRLCRIVEPLALSMGLPAPYVGVIDTGALNAFACGINRKNAVVVVTRGLIDGLDDDELASVIAHELAHIANGDIRLLAAANTCLRMIGWLVRPRMKRVNPLQEIAAFPVIMSVMPPLFLFVLIVSFFAQSALRGSHLVRLLITSSREFIADATAVEATQNPSALVSALERIQGRSLLPDMPPGQDAMMFDGACEGVFATHPTIAQRIRAIIAVTGSMALIAPARRDTRPTRQLSAAASGDRRVSVAGVSLRLPDRQASTPRRAHTDDERNWLGLTPRMSVGACLALVLFAGMHRQDIGNPASLAAALDPRPSNAFMAVAARAAACNFAAIGSLTLGTAKPDKCSGSAMHDFTALQAKVSGPVGALLTSMTEAPKGMYVWPDGHFSNVPPPDVEAAAVKDKRCFRTRPYAPGDRGLHGIDDKPRYDGAFDIRRWLAHSEALAGTTVAAGAGRDQLLKRYVEARKTNFETIHHFFGEPGLTLARASFASPAHRQALRVLDERLRDPSFKDSLSPVALAEAKLLATSPDDFVSCVARRRMTAKL